MVDPAKQFPVPLSGNQQLRSLSYQKFAQALFTCKQPDIKQILLMLTKVVSQTSRITFLIIHCYNDLLHLHTSHLQLDSKITVPIRIFTVSVPIRYPKLSGCRYSQHAFALLQTSAW